MGSNLKCEYEQGGATRAEKLFQGTGPGPNQITASWTYLFIELL